ncbi:MAG: insulinase family protein [Sphingobacteriales bacterium]|nr:MAG: insulinase family protein [Sphingobacteriales bacterium]
MLLNRKAAPAVHDPIEFDFALPPIHRERLANGLPLYWLQGGTQAVAQIELVFPAGIWNEPKPAVAQATAALFKNGTHSKTAHEINEAFEQYGATFKAAAGDDWASVTLYTLTKHLPVLLPMLREVLLEASFPEEELRLYKQNSIQRLLVSLRQCDFVANQQIDALLFGESHPYGRYTKEAAITDLTRDDLVQFHKAQYDLGKAQLFAAGAIGTAEINLIQTLFGTESVQVSAQQQPVPEYPVATSAEPVQRIVNDPNGVQGAIRIGRTFPTRQHPDFTPMVVLNTLMGGYFGSRLMSNIREDKGYTYGIYSSLQPMLHGGSLTIHTEAGRDVCEAAVTEVWKELERLKTEPIPEEELRLVKNYLLGGLLGDLDGPFQLLNRWKALILNGFDKGRFDDNIRTYKTVEAPALQALAQKYYDRNAFYEIVVV